MFAWLQVVLRDISNYSVAASRTYQISTISAISLRVYVSLHISGWFAYNANWVNFRVSVGCDLIPTTGENYLVGV